MPIPQAQPYESENQFFYADKRLIRKDGKVISDPLSTREE